MGAQLSVKNYLYALIEFIEKLQKLIESLCKQQKNFPNFLIQNTIKNNRIKSKPD